MSEYENQFVLKCVVTDNTIRYSKKSNTPSVFLMLLSDSGKTIYHDMFLTEKSAENTIESLYKAFGWSGKISDLNQPILKNKRCSCVCENEVYEGKSRIKVKFVNAESKPLERASNAKANELDATFSTLTTNIKMRARDEGVKFTPESLPVYSANGNDEPLADSDQLPF